MRNYEYDFYDGEYFRKFNIVELNENTMQATFAITCAGKISVQEIDLLQDDNGLYFEYGPLFNKIYLDNFEVA